MDQQIKGVLDQQFCARFGKADEACRYFFAPSRINLIGEHIDYNGGLVFPCAIDIGTYAIVRANEDNVLRLYSVNLEQAGEVSFPLPEYDETRGWVNYPVGVLRYLETLGYPSGGFDAVICGNIPNGSGLSSSASVELLFGEIVNALFYREQIARIELVHAGVWCENEFFGLHSGVMDQYVIGFGKKDHAMALDTSCEEHRDVPFTLPGASIVIMNTNKRRELKDSKYNERRSECERALTLLQKEKPVSYLCELTSADLPLVEALEDPVLRKRARHAVTENARVHQAVKALEDGDLIRLGELLREGNDSIREDYEVTGPELDAITAAANAVEGCYGARMTGAGFSGCAIAIVQNEVIDAFCAQVAAAYREKTGREAHFIISRAADGAREIFPAQE
ncbi:MAG: galactokinase [Ndongobacter sp.]|nr:galactokinase [Ndongobacter sp.]